MHEHLKLSMRLGAITLTVALLLSAAYAITKDRIDQNLKVKTDDAVEQVIPVAPREITSVEVVQTQFDDDVELRKITAAGGDVYYAVMVKSKGYGGDISMVVGIAVDAKNSVTVTGVNITDMSETPGLGTQAKDESFLGAFSGKTGMLTVTSRATGGEHEIAAITGATVTSKAVVNGVNRAVEIVVEIVGA